MSWDYAELSKTAKAAGGPEALTELLIQSGKNQMVPWVAFFSAVGIGAGICVTKAIEFFRNRKKISEQDVELAKQEIIRGINEYDATHSETSGEQEESK